MCAVVVEGEWEAFNGRGHLLFTQQFSCCNRPRHIDTPLLHKNCLGKQFILMSFLNFGLTFDGRYVGC